MQNLPKNWQHERETKIHWLGTVLHLIWCNLNWTEKKDLIRTIYQYTMNLIGNNTYQFMFVCVCVLILNLSLFFQVGCDDCGLFWCHFSCMKMSSSYHDFIQQKWSCCVCSSLLFLYFPFFGEQLKLALPTFEHYYTGCYNCVCTDTGSIVHSFVHIHELYIYYLNLCSWKSLCQFKF